MSVTRSSDHSSSVGELQQMSTISLMLIIKYMHKLAHLSDNLEDAVEQVAAERLAFPESGRCIIRRYKDLVCASVARG